MRGFMRLRVLLKKRSSFTSMRSSAIVRMVRG
jgi:hypothetical protein